MVVSGSQKGRGKMTEVKVVGTNHTSFTVSNLERSITFFTKFLGFRVTSHEPREPAMIQALTGIRGADIDVAYLQMPGHALELIEYKGPEDRGQVECRVCDVGAAHIAFDVEDVEVVVTLGVQYGAKLMGEVLEITGGPNKGGRVAYMRDPDGVTMEFIQRGAS